MYYFFVLQMISGLKTKRRILLTGTPVQVSPVLIFYLTTPSSKWVDLITRIFFSLNIVFFVSQNDLKEFHSLIDLCNPEILGELIIVYMLSPMFLLNEEA